MTVASVLSGAARWHVEQCEARAFIRSLPDACVDALICDPPYSSGGLFRGDRAAPTTVKYVRGDALDKRIEFTGDNRDQRSFLAWCSLWLSEALRVCKPGAPIVVFTDWRQLPTITDAIQAGGWVWRGIVPWDKTEATRPAKGRFRAQAEYAVWGSNGPMPTERGVGVLPGVVRCPNTKAERFHQTTKPVELMRFFSRICVPGGVILDPFTGSGSTGLGAVAEGRRFIGCELHPEYVEIARKRLTEATEQLSFLDVGT